MFMWAIYMLLRFLQFAFSLIALITVSAGFVTTSYYGYTSMLGSSPVTYTQLMTFLGMLYALWLLLMVEMLGFFARPLRAFELAMDSLMSVLLLIAAIVLLVSDYVMNCSVYGVMLRCGSLKAAVVFTFLAMAAFVLSTLLNFFGGRPRDPDAANTTSTPHGMGYTAEHSPTGHGSPKTPTELA
ncbi:hypothetical protein PINS_up010618 [Pythium insidiosum]|nr:hypothetical protein PINS_up010618 [Pythium insidiosum]